MDCRPRISSTRCIWLLLNVIASKDPLDISDDEEDALDKGVAADISAERVFLSPTAQVCCFVRKLTLTGLDGKAFAMLGV